MFLDNFSLGSLIPVGSFIREARVVGSLYLSVCLNSQFHVSFQSAPWFEPSTPLFRAVLQSKSDVDIGGDQHIQLQSTLYDVNPRHHMMWIECLPIYWYGTS